jgi:hypothetical protein
LYGDRFEALKESESKMSEYEVFKMFIEAATNDRFYAIRNYAIQKLEIASPAENRESLKGLFIRIYATDKNTLTRAKALGALNRLFPDNAEVLGLTESALSEQSYAICAEALQALAKNNPKLAMEKAGRFEQESGKDVLFAIANLYASNGGDSQLHFFHDAMKYINGFEQMTFCASYAKCARLCKDPNTVIGAAKDLEIIGKGAGKYIHFTTSKGIRDILSTWESKESVAQTNLDNAIKEKKETGELEKELQKAKQTRSQLAEIYERAK